MIGLDGMFTSCSDISGEARVVTFDSHAVGCHVRNGGECSANQTDFVDQNRTIYRITGGTFTAKQSPGQRLLRRRPRPPSPDRPTERNHLPMSSTSPGRQLPRRGLRARGRLHARGLHRRAAPDRRDLRPVDAEGRLAQAAAGAGPGLRGHPGGPAQGRRAGPAGDRDPRRLRGLGLDKVSATVAGEQVSRDASMATTYMAHTGIGTLPIVYFGNEAQKRKYLPKLASGEWISSYSLSEAASASDALNAKTRAVLSPDGKSWVLNGEKMWLTNSGFADLYIIFAKVDGKDFSAFIIEKGTPGVSLGAEERKLGIKGSSTRPLILADAVIPRENLLGEIGKGHKIAFNVLNVGRFKLGAGVTGGAKLIIAEAVEYARNRTAFGKPITDFGLIRHKIGEMAILAYVAESLVYRIAGSIDRNLADVDSRGHRRASSSASRSTTSSARWPRSGAPRCSTTWSTRRCRSSAGAGFVEDYPAERHYRDARINRIYEGTNEINRLLVPGRLLRRALKQELPIFEKAMALMDELGGGPRPARREPRRPGSWRPRPRWRRAPRRPPSCASGWPPRSTARRSPTSRRSWGTSPTSPWRPTRSRAPCCGRENGRPPGVKTRPGCQEAAVRCFAQDALDRIEISAAPPAGRPGRGGHPARVPGRAGPLHPPGPGQHGGPAAPGGQRRHRGRKVSLLAPNLPAGGNLPGGRTCNRPGVFQGTPRVPCPGKDPPHGVERAFDGGSGDAAGASRAGDPALLPRKADRTGRSSVT